MPWCCPLPPFCKRSTAASDGKRGKYKIKIDNKKRSELLENIFQGLRGIEQIDKLGLTSDKKLQYQNDPVTIKIEKNPRHERKFISELAELVSTKDTIKEVLTECSKLFGATENRETKVLETSAFASKRPKRSKDRFQPYEIPGRDPDFDAISEEESKQPLIDKRTPQETSVSLKIDDKNKEIDNLKRQLEEKERMIKGLQNARPRINQQTETQTSAVGSHTLSDKTAQDQSHDKFQALLKENGRLTVELETVKAQLDSKEEEISSLGAQLEKDQKRYRQTIRELKAKNSEIRKGQELPQRNAKDKDSLADDEKINANASDPLISPKETQLEMVQTKATEKDTKTIPDYHALQRQYQDSARKQEEMKKEIDDLKRNLDTERKKNHDILRKKDEELQTMKTEFDEEIQSLNKKHENLNKVLTQEKSKLSEQLQEREQGYREKENGLLERNNELESKIKSLENQIAESSKESSKPTEEETKKIPLDYDALQNKYKEIEIKQEEMQNEIDDLNSTLDAERKKSQEMLVKREDEIRNMQTKFEEEIQSLKKSRENLNEVLNQEKSILSEQLQKQEQDYTEKENGLKKKLEETRKEREKANLELEEMQGKRNSESEEHLKVIAHRDKTYETEKQQLIEQIADKEETAKISEKHIETLQTEKSTLQKKNEELESKLKSLEDRMAESSKGSEIDTKQALIRDLLSSVKGTSSADAAVATLIDQQAVLIDRLAAEMNAKISSNESSLENISIQNRPMNIAEEYSLLMSNAWLDAKSAMDDEDDDDDEMEAFKVEMLCQVLTVSEEQANCVFALIKKRLLDVLVNPLPWAGSQEIKPSDTQQKSREQALPQALVNNIGDFFRCSASEVSIDFLVQEIDRALKENYNDPNKDASRYLGLEEVIQYTTESARLAWKMVIQRPPMCFEMSQKGQPWKDDGTIEIMWGSNPELEDARIQYYKCPRLLHGDKQMVKGTALVHNTAHPD